MPWTLFFGMWNRGGGHEPLKLAAAEAWTPLPGVACRFISRWPQQREPVVAFLIQRMMSARWARAWRELWIELIGRLSATEHRPVLVNRGLGYLAAARYGLTEDEMLDVLTSDDAVWEDFEAHRHHELERRQLPVVVWSKLSLDLTAYLTERAVPGGTVVAFYHRQLAARAAQGQEARHGDLATYFLGQRAWLDVRQRTPNARRAAELPWQQRSAGWRASARFL